MKHLTDEQLFSLAERTADFAPYDGDQLRQLEHLKKCEPCYDRFCAYSAVTDASTESAACLLFDGKALTAEEVDPLAELRARLSDDAPERNDADLAEPEEDRNLFN